MFSRRPERKVVVYTRAGCHLCDDAIALLRSQARRYRLEISCVDIAADAELTRNFDLEIPVVFIDGKKRFFGQVDPVLLRRVLESTEIG